MSGIQLSKGQVKHGREWAAVHFKEIMSKTKLEFSIRGSKRLMKCWISHRFRLRTTISQLPVAFLLITAAVSSAVTEKALIVFHQTQYYSSVLMSPWLPFVCSSLSVNSVPQCSYRCHFLALLCFSSTSGAAPLQHICTSNSSA